MLPRWLVVQYDGSPIATSEFPAPHGINLYAGTAAYTIAGLEEANETRNNAPMLTCGGLPLDISPARLGEMTPVPHRLMADRRGLARAMMRDGYLYFQKFLDPDLVSDFKQFYLARIAQGGVLGPDAKPLRGRAGTGHIDASELRTQLNDLLRTQEFARFCAQPALSRWYEWFLGDRPYIHAPAVRLTRPNQMGGTAPHYDLLSIRGGTDQVFASWIPIGDCPIARGGVIYLRDSHTFMQLRELTSSQWPGNIDDNAARLADSYDTQWLMADFRAGDMVVHSPYIVHAALDNRDSEGLMRLSVDVRYQRRSEPVGRDPVVLAELGIK